MVPRRSDGAIQIGCTRKCAYVKGGSKYQPLASSPIVCWSWSCSDDHFRHRHRHRRLYWSTDERTEADPHALFKAQLDELEAERKLIFGDDDDNDDNDPMNLQHQQQADDLLSAANQYALQETEYTKERGNSSNTSPTMSETSDDDDRSEDPLNKRCMSPEELRDFHLDREALFLFSQEEKQAWGNSNFGQKVLPRKLLDEIEEARRQKYQQSQHHYSEQQPFRPDQKTSSSRSDENGDLDHNYHHDSFSHVTYDGTSVHMVDVGDKQVTTRMAKAQTKVILPDEVLRAFAASDEELVGPKGPIFATAKLAGIMAAK
jgi:MoaC family